MLIMTVAQPAQPGAQQIPKIPKFHLPAKSPVSHSWHCTNCFLIMQAELALVPFLAYYITSLITASPFLPLIRRHSYDPIILFLLACSTLQKPLLSFTFALSCLHGFRFSTKSRRYLPYSSRLLIWISLPLFPNLLALGLCVFSAAYVLVLISYEFSQGSEDYHEIPPSLPSSVSVSRLPLSLSDTSILKCLFFEAVTPIIDFGARRPLVASDVPHLKPSFQAEVSAKELGFGPSNEGILSSVLRAFSLKLIRSVIIKAGCDLVGLIPPIALRGVLQGSRVAAIMLVVAMLGRNLMQAQYFEQCVLTYVGIRGALNSKIFRKASRLCLKAQKKFPSGVVQNLLATDADRVGIAFREIHYIWGIPFQFCSTLLLLAFMIGTGPSIAAIFSVFLILPIQAWFMKKAKKLRQTASRHTDRRIHLTSEMLHAVKLIKLYTWEKPFRVSIDLERDRELGVIIKAGTYQAAILAVVDSIPTIMCASCFVTYVILNHSLDASVIFPALALLNTLRTPIMALPNNIFKSILGVASIQRLDSFFEAAEMSMETREETREQGNGEKRNFDIVMDNASIGYSKSGPVLSNVNVRIKPGSLVNIVGPTAAGKTTFLRAILGEVIVKGIHKIPSVPIAYCPQIPFIISGSFQDNICFGDPCSNEKVEAAMRAGCLQDDLTRFRHGAQTEVKGTVLSGGQRARLGFSRAYFANKSIALLDDVLSGVNSEVAARLWNEIEKMPGTRIVVQNRIPDSMHVDLVLRMEGGRVQAIPKQDPRLRPSASSNGISQRSFQASLYTEGSTQDTKHYQAGLKHILTEPEHKRSGSIGLGYFVDYFKASGGISNGVILVFLAFSNQVFSLMMNYWISIWSGSAHTTAPASQKDPNSIRTFLLVYIIVSLAVVTISAISAVAIALISARASRTLHRAMLQSVVKAPIQWFDTTPIGRILNRFNSDMDKIDASLPWTIDAFVYLSAKLLGIIAIVLTFLPLATVPFIFAFAGFLRLQHCYRRSKIDLARLESMSKSPLYSHFGETLTGISSIRAYGKTDVAQSIHHKLTSRYLAHVYTSFAINRWLSNRLEVLSALFVGSTTFLLLHYGNCVTPATAGFLLSYIILLPQTMLNTIRNFTEFESNMSSVERVSEYAALPREDPASREVTVCSEENAAGKVEFHNVVLRYREDQKAALDGISFEIQAGQVIGIVGRTGAGKSSLVSSLFRLTNISSGAILIDGADISTLSLHELRNKISIIPQETLVFTGTVRWNLDPSGVHSDAELCRALKICGLAGYDDDTGAGLSPDTDLGATGEGLSTLSLGQQQLLCLCRALLRRKKITILDESTSFVDQKVDRKVQRIVRDYIACKSTVLIVAHRIETIMHADKVLVLNEGRVVAYGPPQTLLRTSEAFVRMLHLSESQVQASTSQ
eukprot:Plantae.Rhodophyta-Hildenbrandia_rubra.ctg6556.p1 GENE.Plantae.Rhodophyta-Hildenbrandia_rubra.ctg6556~~Plantae.Rhodophyta-Hildenbrandia_rubra.ctg6556.p1  ORF type:complete len:1405 (+),score=130.47 Plantae.Rhodophyta-Hildenbrandia_rubra.ctg6556:224-4438(+)